MSDFNLREPIRLSDIDNLLEDSIFSSSNGAKLAEYLRKKRGPTGRVRLQNIFEHAAGNIPRPIFNFEMESSDPNPLPESPTPSQDAINNIAMSPASVPIAGTSGLVTTGDNIDRPVSPKPANRVLSPVVVLSDVRASPLKVTDKPSESAVNNMSRKALINQYHRKNLTKCELLRQITSSTPKLDSVAQLSRLSALTTSISPILEVGSSQQSDKQSVVIQPVQPLTIPAELPIDSAVPQQILAPCTQATTESTPQKKVVSTATIPAPLSPDIIPETPSPVQEEVVESPRVSHSMLPKKLSVTFNNLQIQDVNESIENITSDESGAIGAEQIIEHEDVIHDIHLIQEDMSLEEDQPVNQENQTVQKQPVSMGASFIERNAENSFITKSILKDSFSAKRRKAHSLRVSFSEQLVQQREISPAPSIPEAHYTSSDDSSDLSEDDELQDGDYQVIDEVYSDEGDCNPGKIVDNCTTYQHLYNQMSDIHARTPSPQINVIDEEPVQWYETRTPRKISEKDKLLAPASCTKDNKTDLRLVDIITDWDDEDDDEEQEVPPANESQSLPIDIPETQATIQNPNVTVCNPMDISNVEDSAERLIELPPPPVSCNNSAEVERVDISPDRQITPPIQFTSSAKRRFLRENEDALITRLQNELPPTNEQPLSPPDTPERVPDTLMDIVQSFRDLQPPPATQVSKKTIIPVKKPRRQTIAIDPATNSYFETVVQPFAKPKKSQLLTTAQKRKLYASSNAIEKKIEKYPVPMKNLQIIVQKLRLDNFFDMLSESDKATLAKANDLELENLPNIPSGVSETSEEAESEKIVDSGNEEQPHKTPVQQTEERVEKPVQFTNAIFDNESGFLGFEDEVVAHSINFKGSNDKDTKKKAKPNLQNKKKLGKNKTKRVDDSEENTVETALEMDKTKPRMNETPGIFNTTLDDKQAEGEERVSPAEINSHAIKDNMVEECTQQSVVTKEPKEKPNVKIVGRKSARRKKGPEQSKTKRNTAPSKQNDEPTDERLNSAQLESPQTDNSSDVQNTKSVDQNNLGLQKVNESEQKITSNKGESSREKEIVGHVGSNEEKQLRHEEQSQEAEVLPVDHENQVAQKQPVLPKDRLSDINATKSILKDSFSPKKRSSECLRVSFSEQLIQQRECYPTPSVAESQHIRSEDNLNVIQNNDTVENAVNNNECVLNKPQEDFHGRNSPSQTNLIEKEPVQRYQTRASRQNSENNKDKLLTLTTAANGKNVDHLLADINTDSVNDTEAVQETRVKQSQLPIDAPEPQTTNQNLNIAECNPKDNAASEKSAESVTERSKSPVSLEGVIESSNRIEAHNAEASVVTKNLSIIVEKLCLDHLVDMPAESEKAPSIASNNGEPEEVSSNPCVVKDVSDKTEHEKNVECRNEEQERTSPCVHQSEKGLKESDKSADAILVNKQKMVTFEEGVDLLPSNNDKDSHPKDRKTLKPNLRTRRILSRNKQYETCNSEDKTEAPLEIVEERLNELPPANREEQKNSNEQNAHAIEVTRADEHSQQQAATAKEMKKGTNATITGRMATRRTKLTQNDDLGPKQSEIKRNAVLKQNDDNKNPRLNSGEIQSLKPSSHAGVLATENVDPNHAEEHIDSQATIETVNSVALNAKSDRQRRSPRNDKETLQSSEVSTTFNTDNEKDAFKSSETDQNSQQSSIDAASTMLIASTPYPAKDKSSLPLKKRFGRHSNKSSADNQDSEQKSKKRRAKKPQTQKAGEYHEKYTTEKPEKKISKFYMIDDDTDDLWLPYKKSLKNKYNRQLRKNVDKNASPVMQQDLINREKQESPVEIRRSTRTRRLAGEVISRNPNLKSIYDKPNYCPITEAEVIKLTLEARKRAEEKKKAKAKTKDVANIFKRKRVQEDISESSTSKRNRSEEIPATNTETTPPAVLDEATHDSTTETEKNLSKEKMHAFSWLMKLMQANGLQSTGVQNPGLIEGGQYMHYSQEHLSYSERNGIQYSFYLYSETENYGYMRFAPSAVKKLTKTDKFLLKFLILSGNLTIQLNGNTRQLKGGDFLMLTPYSTYAIENGKDISMIFMIKLCPSLCDG